MQSAQACSCGSLIVVDGFVPTAHILRLKIVVWATPLRLEARSIGAAERRHRVT